MERSTAPGWKSSFLVGAPDPNSAACTPLAIRVWNFNLWPMMSFFASCRRGVGEKTHSSGFAFEGAASPAGAAPSAWGSEASFVVCSLRRRHEAAVPAGVASGNGARTRCASSGAARSPGP